MSCLIYFKYYMNSWNAFLKAHRGEGYSMAKLSEMYHRNAADAMDFASMINQHAELYPEWAETPPTINVSRQTPVAATRNPVVVPGMKPRPSGFTLGSSLYQKRLAQRQSKENK
jgi:hypothetical protein